MKKALILLFTGITIAMFGQHTKLTEKEMADSVKTVTVVTKFSKENAHKDGYSLSGYLVDLTYDQAEKLDGKTVKITGKIRTHTGLKNEPTEYDKNGRVIIKQGRLEDTEYLYDYTIEIIEDKKK